MTRERVAVRLPLLALGAVLAAAGCAKPYQVAQVSGTVKMNGKPLVGAWVHFAPKATRGKNDPGPTAHGQTDKEGRYTLKIRPEQPGAVVGPCRVYISLRTGGAPAGGEQADAGGRSRERETIPRRYNEETTLERTVPSAGSEENFDLKSP